MKYLVIALLMLSTSAQATFLYSADGTRIAENDSIAKVITQLGQPIIKTQEQVCLATKDELCTRWASYEKWHYLIEEYLWVLEIREGRVHSLEWHINQ